MRSNAWAPGPSALPDHVIEEICFLEMQLQTTHNHLQKLDKDTRLMLAQQKFLQALRDNLLKRFTDSC